MKHSIKVGVSFGVTSRIITTLGLIVGLNSATSSSLAVIGGILTIAIADAFSDSLGIHISEESENKHSKKEIWQSTFSTFLAKFIFALIFVIPFLVFNMKTAVIISIVLGLLLLAVFSFKIAKKQRGAKLWKVILEHLLIAVIVIVITDYVGNFIGRVFV